MNNSSRRLVEPTYKKEVIDLATADPKPVVFKKSGKKLPVINRRTRHAFNKGNHPKVVEYRQRRRELKKAIIKAIRESVFRHYANSVARANADSGVISHPTSKDADDISALMSLTRKAA